LSTSGDTDWKSGQASISARSCSGERAQLSLFAPFSSSSGSARQTRTSLVATPSGQPCSPLLAMSALLMLPGSNGQRAFSARCTLFSIAHGVGSSAVS
jgi:hypothetical protein